MDIRNEKCVMVIDEDLPLGMIANTAGILGITLGKHIPGAVGPDVQDKSGKFHLGIIATPVPVLKAGKERLRMIREQLYQAEFQELTAVDFFDAAQSCNVYEEYMEKLSGVEEKDLVYYGIGICGKKKLVNRLTGNLPLMR